MLFIFPKKDSEDKKAWKRFILTLIGIWILYLVTNRLNAFTPAILSLSPIDRFFPFLPLSVWVYISYFFIFTCAFFLENNNEQANNFIKSIIFINIVSNLFFIFSPITYLRWNYQLPQETDYFTQLCFKAIYSVDAPTNCFPSLHVSMAFISSFLWYGRDRRRFIIFLLWAICIAISTLTTKQHYFADVISGFLLSLGTYIYMFRIKKLRSSY